MSNYFLPYQAKWINDDADLKLYEKSRRIGITYATSFRCVDKLATRKGFTQWVSSRDMLTAQEFIGQYVKKWCSHLNVAAEGLAARDPEVLEVATDEGIAKVQAFIARVHHDDGISRIISLSSTPQAFAGKGGDVLLDELDLHDDPGTLLAMATPCISWGNQLEAVSAYDPKKNAESTFSQLCNDARAKNPMGWSFHHTTVDEAIGQGFVEKINQVKGKNYSREEWRARQRRMCRTEDDWLSQYMCQPASDSKALLSYETIMGCEMPWGARDSIDGHGPKYVGMDIGREKDLTVIWVIERLGDVYWTTAVHVLEKCPFSAQLDRLLSILNNERVVRCCIDKTGLGMMLAEEAAKKAACTIVEGITFTAAAKDEMAVHLVQTFEDRRVRVPDDDAVRADLHKVRKIVTASGNTRYDADHDKDGHADRFWALAMAIEAGWSGAAMAIPPTVLTVARGLDFWGRTA